MAGSSIQNTDRNIVIQPVYLSRAFRLLSMKIVYVNFVWQQRMAILQGNRVCYGVWHILRRVELEVGYVEVTKKPKSLTDFDVCLSKDVKEC